jgi:hypothetical protein
LAKNSANQMKNQVNKAELSGYKLSKMVVNQCKIHKQSYRKINCQKLVQAI